MKTTAISLFPELFNKLKSNSQLPIERPDGLPVDRLNQLVKVEGRGPEISRPPLYLHKWWARRFGSVFRSILLGVLLEDGKDVWSEHYNAHAFTGSIICDPFMGGGTTLFEASRLGAKVIGCDLNPVAWWTTRMALKQPESWLALEETYIRLEREALLRFGELYVTTCPICEAPTATSRHLRWVRVLPCDHCGTSNSLFRSNILGKYLGGHWFHCPSCEFVYFSKIGNGAAELCPRCKNIYDAREGNLVRGTFKCHSCDGLTKTREAMSKDANPQKSVRLFAVLYDCPTHGWGLAEPTEIDHHNHERAVVQLAASEHVLAIPPEPISTKDRIDPRPLNYGISTWRQMFMPRQLLVLGWMASQVRQFPPDTKDTFATIISQLVNYTNSFCVPRPNRPAAISWIFRMHAFVPATDFIEANPLSGEKASGSFQSLFLRSVSKAYQYRNQPTERRVDSLINERTTSVLIPDEKVHPVFVEHWNDLICKDRGALLLNQSSDTLPIPDKSVSHVVTDPPFYDNVTYGELSEFNYVWLRQMLGRDYDPFISPLMNHDAELIASKHIGKGDAFYRDGMTAVFKECHRIMRDDGRLVFTFHHKATAAWSTLLDALIGARFRVTAIHSVMSESDRSLHIMDGDTIEYDVVIVCCKSDDRVCIAWSVLLDKMRSEAISLTDQMHLLHSQSLSNVTSVLFGHCLKLLSEYTAIDVRSNKPVELSASINAAINIANEMTGLKMPNKDVNTL